MMMTTAAVTNYTLHTVFADNLPQQHILMVRHLECDVIQPFPVLTGVAYICSATRLLPSSALSVV